MSDDAGGQPIMAKDSLEFAESIIDTVREPLAILDDQLRVRSANRSFYLAFGVTPEETENRLIYEIGNGQWNIPRLRTLLEEILPENHTFRDFEVDHIFEGIGRRRMLLNARKIWRVGNHSHLILLAIEDITNLWRAEVELKDSRERYRLIVESATAYGIFTTDMKGIVTTWNAGACLIFGYREAEILGRDARVIYTPEDLAAGVADVEMRTAEAEGRALDERWHSRKNGERFWANGLVMPLKDDANQTRGFLKILRDMTEQQQLEASLRQRSADLEEADASKNTFLAMLAHELRNPLAAIRNALTVAARTETKEDIGWCHDVINRQVLNFGILIDDLLDVARITQGKIQLRRELVDASRVILQAVETIRPLVDEKKHDLIHIFTSPGLYLDADPTRIEQILVNLLANAAKYTPPGGRIQLTAGAEDGEVVIRISDNGVGISPEMLTRLFDLFAQADRSLARSEGGLGIGLMVAKTLAELQGGSVSAMSDGPGTGSEFILRFPAVEAPPKMVKVPEAPAILEARRLQVLVVDDNVDTAKGMAKLLKISGHEVRIATSGIDAIEAARNACPDVVLLDIGLPGMDGYEVAKKLRQEICPDERIIAISGYGDEETRRRTKEAGFNDHFVKPVDYDALISLLSQPRTAN